jgi:hypothetical protein
MGDLTIRALSTETWSDFARIVEKHNGVWGGCWCVWFHPREPDRKRSKEGNKAYKRKLVDEGKAHAALVYDGDSCVAWCQFGPPPELPNIYHRKEVESRMTTPDWRITCIFVDRDSRRRGLSLFALNGALELIGGLGGGVVESYPHDTQGQKVSSSFLYNGTRQIFETAGFTHDGTKGKRNCIMRKTVAGLTSG